MKTTHRNLFATYLLGVSLLAAQDVSAVKTLKWRLIGPFRGGRVAAVTGLDSQPKCLLLRRRCRRSLENGQRWFQLAVRFGRPTLRYSLDRRHCGSASDPNIVYAGTGEYDIRGNVSSGDGVYKSMDAGKTWKHLGLDNTRQISRVLVNPRNPDLVYVAALGHVWAPNEERGIYRSKDGGKTWDKIYSRGQKAGASELVFDPTNANILYAGFWEAYRKPWDLESGGPSSGIFKSTDGGDTWTELTKNPGLPKGVIGNVGLTVSAANPDRIWALLEAEDGGVFRSDDAGRHGRRSTKSASFASAPGITAVSLPTRKIRTKCMQRTSGSFGPMMPVRHGILSPLHTGTITSSGSLPPIPNA